MNILTPTGYIPIEQAAPGTELVYFDLATGERKVNTLLSIEKLTDGGTIPVDLFTAHLRAGDPANGGAETWVRNLTHSPDEVEQETLKCLLDISAIPNETVLVSIEQQSEPNPFTFYRINNQWTLYKDQFVWANLNVVYARNLQIGDTIYDDQDGDLTVTSIEEVIADSWWRLSVSGDHSYIVDGLQLHNATLYAKAAGGNWSSANTWSATSSAGADNAGPPTNVIDTIFDAGAIVAVVVDTATCAAKTVTCQAAANSITFTATKALSVDGSVTFFAGMTVAGTGTLVIQASSTLTSGGIIFPGRLQFFGNNTTVLLGNWVNTGLVTNSGTKVLNQTTNETFTCNGGYTSTSAISGTATIILGGGTWSGTGAISNNLTIQPEAANVIVSGSVAYNTGTLAFIASGSGKTITTTGSTLTIGASCTLNTSGMSWNDIVPTVSALGITLLSPLSVTGTWILNGFTGVIFAGNFNVTIANLILIGNSTTSSRTMKFVSGTTVTITTSMLICGYRDVSFNVGLLASISSSSFSLVYQGTAANCKVFNTTFTDVDASGSSIPIDNWYGGTLTRTVNIRNYTSANIGGGGHPIQGAFSEGAFR